jgi:2-iminobutanoate/2-iminopropanoate deaminase
MPDALLYPITLQLSLDEGDFMLERLQVPAAPKPQGPYSSVVRAGDFLFLSGQGPVDPATGVMQSEASVHEQTRLVLQNLQTVLQGCGAGLEDVVKCSVFLLDVNDFSAMNEVYAEVFGDTKPARTTVAAGMVAPGMKVEIDCVAYRPKI